MPQLTFLLTEHGHKYTQRVSDVVGALPLCWDPTDPRPAITQHDERQMGNGRWLDSFPTMWKFDPTDNSLKFSSDPRMKPLAEAHLPLTSERIYVYGHAWVCIVQADGTFSVDRRN